MPIFQAAYRDPLKAMTIKALEERQKAAALETAKAAQAEPIANPWQGLAHITNILGGQMGEARAGNALASNREALAQIMAGINQDTGATSEQIAQINQRDPDLAKTYYEAAMKQRDATAQRTFQHGENELTRTGQADLQNDQQRAQADAARIEAENAVKTATTLAERQAAEKRLEEVNAAKQASAQAVQDATLAPDRAKLEIALKNGTISQPNYDKAIAGLDAADAAKAPDAYGPMRKGSDLGYTGPAADLLFQQNLKTQQWEQVGGKGTNVSVNSGKESKLDETLGSKEGENWAAFQGARDIAAGSTNDFQMLDELIKMAPQGPLVGNLAKAFPGVSNAATAFNSIVKRVAPTLHVKGSGSTSDLEFGSMLESLPNLGNHPEANALIAGMMKAKAALNIERGNVVDAYRNGDLSSVDARKKLQEISTRSIMSQELRSLMDNVKGSGAGAGADGAQEPQRPSNVSAEEWEHMTPEERNLFR